MRALSPQPRYRIYSRLADYLSAFPSLLTGSYAAGQWRDVLQERIKADFNVPYALCMPQARVALHLAVAAVASPGAEVILSPNTIADVINMVITAGAKPIFCDIDEKTGNIDAELVEELVTPNTVAILATHLYGLVAPMKRLREISENMGFT
jgi:perosamine synthetase